MTGRPTARSAVLLGAIGVIAWLAVSCTSSGKAQSPTTTAAATVTAAASPTSSVPTGACAHASCAVSMGMEVHVVKIDRTLHCVDADTSGLCTAELRPGGVEVDLDFRNTGSTSQPIALDGLHLQTADGQLHGYGPIAQVAGSSGGPHDCIPSTDGSLVSLAPGGEARNVAVCFAVPPSSSAGPLMLHYQEQDPGPTGTIDLG